MQNNEKFHRTSVFLRILAIMILALFVIISNNAFAQIQTLHNQTLYEAVRQSSGLNENSKIDVGTFPYAIGTGATLNTMYVANLEDNSISVISVQDNRKIGEDIPVGRGPISIAVNDIRGTAYVANNLNASISVISVQDNRNIGEDIPVGHQPIAVEVDETTDKVFIADHLANRISVISAENYGKIGEDIPVGYGPVAIAVDINTHTVYVANRDSDTISVISALNNTKIGEDILVGDNPAAIAFNLEPNISKVYVANSWDDTVSVISTKNNTRIGEDIPVGDNPAAIAVNERTNTVYVANRDSNTVSVISTGNNTRIGEDIPVGLSPVGIAVNERTNTVYVANSGSNSVSVIDGVNYKVVAGITFHVKPFNSGSIVCDDFTTPSPDDLTAPTGRQIYLYSGDKCTAKPYEGYEFLSWEENLEDDSTQLINVSSPASPLDSFLEYLSQNKSSDKPEAKLTTKFGNFTANFRAAPPPLPPEYQVLFVSVFLTSVASLVTAWFGSRKKDK